MLATLRFWPLLGLSLTYAATINVIPASDTSLITYSPGWSLEFSQSTQDSFMQAEGISCYLSVTLPINASSVSYVGFKQDGGSMYGYTLDCEENCLLQTANGSDPTVTDVTTAPQSTLFTLDLDPSTQHTLYVYNIPSNAPDGSSQINLNNFNVALASDVSAGEGLPTPSNTDNTGSTSSTTSSAGSSSTSEQGSTSTTPTSPSSSANPISSSASPSASATSSSSNGVSTTPTNVGTSLSSAQTGSTGTDPSGSSTTGSAVLPVISSSSTAESGNGKGTGAEAAGSSSGSGKTGGLSKSVAIGVSVLAVVFGGGVIAALFVFIRQRRQKHRNSYPGSSSGSQPPLSPTGSIIPIMPPPQMRGASMTYSPAIPNPFIDPPSDSPPLDIPFNSSLMQRRMEGRTSPGSPASPAPNIPLPEIPRGATDTRSSSPATTYARSDLWITRSPAKPSFAVL
ncbi:hypothetical protein MVEN_01904600 [Mycena venus]|uniref:Mid2 domain-containing protein n=1 Tax=Mycena venus TaxID=2733690 RepID=A0A8H6XG05_9AGAR|nr:hypothetical protein MVEN_01904600 [Mycena venus]